MPNPYPHLFSPLQVGHVTLKNRIIAAPTSLQDLTAEGYLTPDNVSYYELKALGGAAVVTVGESIVHTATGKSHNRQICLDDPNTLPGLTRTANAIKRAGALAGIELSHGGKYAGLASIGGDLTGDKKAYGPSEATTPEGERIYAMSTEMIETIIAAFGTGARLCKTAGFDLVMVHAAHGWLFNQFLSPLENKRTDQYGGSLENRARFLLRVLEEVRAAVGPGFPIELRMNGDDFIPGAVTTEIYLQLARMVEPWVDMVNVSAGSHDAEGLFVRTHPSMFLEHGCNVYLAEAIKKAVSIPVSCVGGIHSPELAEEIIATGKADLVMLGRALLADPYFPKKAMRGEQDDITPCLRCFCCFENTINTAVLRCTVNPVIGNELDVRYHTLKTSNPRRVLVVGGGPGGMQAAVTAAQAGHEVVLCEKKSELGGALSFAREVPFKRELYDFVRVLERRVRRERIRVDLDTTADANYVKGVAPDVIIIAAGAKPYVPPLPGIDSPQVRHAMDCEGKGSTLGQQIVIIGGGLVGCELGLSLGMEGKQVTVVEMCSQLAPDANDLHKMALKLEFDKYITAAVGTKVTRITPEGVYGVDTAGDEVFFPADTVVLAAGMKSDAETVKALYGLADEVYPIGDCKRVGQVLQAVTEGYFVAREL